jgi:hypothetical protein
MAYRDVGQRREQDAEALRNGHVRCELKTPYRDDIAVGPEYSCSPGKIGIMMKSLGHRALSTLSRFSWASSARVRRIPCDLGLGSVETFPNTIVRVLLVAATYGPVWIQVELAAGIQ